jgi:hypothetical protein
LSTAQARTSRDCFGRALAAAEAESGGAERLQKALGAQVMTAFERLMGLILTAMSVEMLLGGIREFVKTL